MTTEVDTARLIVWMREFARVVAKEKQALSELDSASGDADHGANLDRGMKAVNAMIDSRSEHGKPGEFLKNVGMTIVSKVGGSSGALYGTVFLRMAATAGNVADTIDAPCFEKALRAAVQGIIDRGRVKAGDKTMYDALAPAAEAFETALRQGKDFETCLGLAAKAASAGAQATAAMRARKGKSSYIGEKSIGAIDPGAASIALFVKTAGAMIEVEAA